MQVSQYLPISIFIQKKKKVKYAIYLKYSHIIPGWWYTYPSEKY